jgi:cytochrome c5
MRLSFVPAVALAALAAAALPLSGAALSQAPQEASPRQEAVPSELSPEDKNASPFPPGRHAALVKKICVDCHTAKPILDLRYSKDDAESFYKNMVSSDLTTEQAQQIIEYLTTTLGQ